MIDEWISGMYASTKAKRSIDFQVVGDTDTFIADIAVI